MPYLLTVLLIASLLVNGLFVFLLWVIGDENKELKDRVYAGEYMVRELARENNALLFAGGSWTSTRSKS